GAMHGRPYRSTRLSRPGPRTHEITMSTGSSGSVAFFDARFEPGSMVDECPTASMPGRRHAPFRWVSPSRHRPHHHHGAWSGRSVSYILHNLPVSVPPFR